METSPQPLPSEISATVARCHGEPVAVAAQQGECVVMSMQVFRGMLEIGSDEDYEASVASIRRSLAQCKAGQSQEADDFFGALEKKYES